MRFPEKRSTAFVGGNVWTAGYAGPRTLDVLVRGNRIAAVTEPGGLDGADATRELDGRVLTPGFQDAHLHLGSGGQDLLGCDLAGCTTPEEVYDRIQRYADAHPGVPWIIGGGWTREIFDHTGPYKEQLDTLTGNRPAFLQPYDRHGAWVNSAALQAAGITAATPDPAGGSFTRTETGALTGMVEETAVAAIRKVMPALSTREVMDAILAAQDHLIPLGITSVQDALVGTGLGMIDQLDAFRELVAGDELRLRLTTALWWDQTRGVEQLPELVERRRILETAARPDRIVADTVKMMIDGANQLFMTAEQITAATVALDAAGFTVHYHSYGDATTHWVLNAVEAAITANGRGRRHHIAHLFVVAEPDFARFAELDVTANVQGYWAGSDVAHHHITRSTMTTDPETREYPFGRIHTAGARLAAGSDWPVTTADPFRAAQVAAGLPTDEPAVSIDERDRLDLITTLTAFTTGSAHVNGRGDRTGRIAVGHLADLVVLDPAAFTGTLSAAEAVHEVWIDGRPVHQKH